MKNEVEIDPDTPLRLKTAVEVAFPFGGMTVSGLRREAKKGHLAIEEIAGKQFTTLRHIQEMREKCRDNPRVRDCGLIQNEKKMGNSASGQRGLSATERAKISTSCARGERAEAERALAKYIAAKYQPSRQRDRDPAQTLVLDVLNLYMAEVASKHSRPDETKQRILTLADFWQPYMLTDISGELCRDYVKWRVGQPWKSSKPEITNCPARTVTEATARRELEDLRAAINHHIGENRCSQVISVVLPQKSAPRANWLTRSQVAQLNSGSVASQTGISR